MKWKDETSFSQKDKDRTPRRWTTNAAGIRIVVTKHIHSDPREWILVCPPFADRMVIGDSTADDAKERAVAWISEKLRASLAALTPNVGAKPKTTAAPMPE